MVTASQEILGRTRATGRILRNRGEAEHEWSVGRGVIDTPDEKGFRTDPLAVLNPRVSGRGCQMEGLMTRDLNATDIDEGEIMMRLSSEVDIQPRGQAILRFTVPREAKGRWQMGCFLSGRYEPAMYGTIGISETVPLARTAEGLRCGRMRRDPSGQAEARRQASNSAVRRRRYSGPTGRHGRYG